MRVTRSAMRFSNWSTFRIEVSSRLISVSSVSCRACRETRVYSRAFSMPTAMREANSVSSRLCSSVKAPGCGASTSMTPMTLFLAISGTASSERTPGVELMKFSSAATSLTSTGSRDFDRPPGDALADFDADALGDLRRMSHLEADAQLLRLLVQQQDGEDFVVDEALQHLGHALQQSVQVERGVDRVRYLKQVGIERRRHRGAAGWRKTSSWNS